jgi:hypothetical protein
MDGSSRLTAEGEGDDGAAVSIPQLDFPAIGFSGSGTGYDSFVPSVQNTSREVDTRGSFDESDLVNPDLTAEGLNWVHTIDRTWISDNQWSYTEQIVMVFNLGDSASDGGDLTSLTTGDETDNGLDESGSWSSTTGVTRGGFFMLTFSASLGMTTPAAAGVKWSIDVNFRDTLGVTADAEGESTGTPNASSVENDSLPDDFVSHATWDASIGLTVYSGGTFSVSSTPSLVSTGIQRDVTVSGSNDLGGNVNFTSNWSSSSSSGNLIPLDIGGCYTCSSGASSSPLPDGGDLGI